MTKRKKQKLFKLSKIIIIIIFLMLILGGYIIIEKNLEFVLNGKQDYSIYLNSEYIEAGYEAKLFNIDLNKYVEVDNKLNSQKLGEYQIIYTLKFIFCEKIRYRNIKVIEEEKKTVEITEPKLKSDYPPINGYENAVLGPKYIDGILIVNKTYAIPQDFKSPDAQIASTALKQLQAAALLDGFNIDLVSGYRSYARQKNIYENNVANRGYDETDKYSARPGHSEHQTGLAFDVGSVTYTYGETPSGQWLNKNCAKYGFIIRYPQGKEHITGYGYEPWHIRYVGIDIATEIMEKEITLEEYFNLV